MGRNKNRLSYEDISEWPASFILFAPHNSLSQVASYFEHHDVDSWASVTDPNSLIGHLDDLQSHLHEMLITNSEDNRFKVTRISSISLCSALTTLYRNIQHCTLINLCSQMRKKWIRQMKRWKMCQSGFHLTDFYCRSSTEYSKVDFYQIW